MPVHTDSYQIRHAITQAAWDIITRRGIRDLTVRNLAAESGIAMSTMRYHFPQQSVVLSFVMGMVESTIRQRLFRLMADPNIRLVDLAEQFLPLDKQREREASVWYQFLSEGHDPLIAQMRQRFYDEQLGLLAAWQQRAAGAEYTTDQALAQARLLQAVINGLAVQYLADPSASHRRLIRQQLADYLAAA